MKKDSISLTVETLIQSLELNRQAQHELSGDSLKRDETRLKLIKNIETARADSFTAIGQYSDLPSTNNKNRLAKFRRIEVDSERALEDFDLSNSHDDMGLLLEAERSLKAKLKHIRLSEGSDSLKAELEQLKARLKNDLPRFLGIVSVTSKTPAGILDVDFVLSSQLKFRQAFEQQCRDILKELEFEEPL